MDDFINNVIPFDKIVFWKLDEGLPEILSRINSNEYIHALYSKRPAFKTPADLSLSYLEICYSEEVELRLFREVIPSLFPETASDPEAKLYYMFDGPRINPNYSRNTAPLWLGCIDDENYFFINTIKINLESKIKETHNRFWKILDLSLTRIKP
jgi:hypothetical protein